MASDRIAYGDGLYRLSDDPRCMFESHSSYNCSFDRAFKIYIGGSEVVYTQVCDNHLARILKQLSRDVNCYEFKVRVI
jgi:hypothetical protein